MGLKLIWHTSKHAKVCQEAPQHGSETIPFPSKTATPTQNNTVKLTYEFCFHSHTG